MKNTYNSDKWGKVLVEVSSNTGNIHFNTMSTMESLSDSRCDKLFDKVGASAMKNNAFGGVYGLDGNWYITASDAYVSKDFVVSLRDSSGIMGPGYYGNPARIEVLAKLTLLKNLGDADCLVYQLSTGLAATLDASGELNVFGFETATLGEVAEVSVEL